MIEAGVILFVEKDNKFLFGKRHKTHGEGTYTVPSGHMNFGETWERAGQRELYEESGLNVNEEDIKVLGTVNQPGTEFHYINTVLHTKEAFGDLVGSEECDEWTYYSLDELPKPIYHMILPALDLLKGVFQK